MDCNNFRFLYGHQRGPLHYLFTSKAFFSYLYILVLCFDVAGFPQMLGKPCWCAFLRRRQCKALGDLWELAGGFLTGVGGPAWCWRSSEGRFMSGRSFHPHCAHCLHRVCLIALETNTHIIACPSVWWKGVWEGRSTSPYIYSPFLTRVLYPALISPAGTSENSVRKMGSLSPCSLLLAHSYLLLSPIRFIS